MASKIIRAGRVDSDRARQPYGLNLLDQTPWAELMVASLPNDVEPAWAKEQLETYKTILSNDWIIPVQPERRLWS